MDSRVNFKRVGAPITLDHDAIRALIQQGHTDGEIAKQIDCCRRSVGRLRHQWGLLATPGLRWQRIAERLRAHGMAWGAQTRVAHELGISIGTVNRACKRLGLNLRQNNEWKEPGGRMTTIKSCPTQKKRGRTPRLDLHAQIRDLNAKGHNDRAIAEQVNMSYSHVTLLRRQWGLPSTIEMRARGLQTQALRRKKSRSPKKLPQSIRRGRVCSPQQPQKSQKGDRGEIRAMMLAGEQNRVIAARFGMSRQRVSQLRKKWGLPTAKSDKSVVIKRRERVAWMRANGATYKEIAQKLGISVWAVLAHLKALRKAGWSV